MTEPRVEVAGLAIAGEVWLAAPPSRVFRALTTPALLEAWWGDAAVYTTHDWQLRVDVGAPWRCEVRLVNGRRHHIAGTVLEVVPERRLRLSWQPSWDQMPVTEVSFELEPQRGGTRLALKHRGFRPDFTGLETHRVGWPWVLRWLAADLAEPIDHPDGLPHHAALAGVALGNPACPGAGRILASVRHRATAIGLVALVFVVYANSFGVGFPFDNKSIVLDDPRVRAATWTNLHLILTRDYWWPKFAGGVYRPLTTLSYLLNYTVLGNADRPAGYHLVNVLLHAANVLLAYRLGLAVSGGAGAAAATAALFATHPIATEAVTNIVGRADLLAGLAVLAGLVAHVQSTRAAGWRALAWRVVVALAAGLGLLAKESAIALLGVVVLYDLVFRPGTVRAAVRQIARAGLVVGCPLLALWFLRAWVLAPLPARPWSAVDNPLLAADFWTARLTAVRVIGEYGWLLVWPQWLSPDYSYAQVPLVGWRQGGFATGLAAVTLAVIVGMLAAAVRFRRTLPAASFWIGFFLVTLLPTANLLILVGSIKAERFLYLPSLGFAGAIVLVVRAALRRLVGTGPPAARAGVLALGLLVAAYGLRTAARNRDWQDPVRLWESAVAAAPRSFKTHQALAYVLSSDEATRRRHADRIVDEAEAALRILETAPLLGAAEPSTVALDVGRYRFLRAGERSGDERLADLTRAAEVLARAERLDRAERETRQQEERRRGRGADDVPEFGRWEIYHYLGRTRLELGDADGAREAFAWARRLVPEDVRPYHGLARAELVAGALTPAAVALHEVLLLDPADPEALPMLLDVYERLDPDGCAVVQGPIRRIDPRCPRVLADRCAAHADLARGLDEARRAQAARRIEAAAPRACPPAAARR